MRNRPPKLTIGMPVFNGGLFIREAIDSLLAQTFSDFELVISDNASTDNTQAICYEYENLDSRVRYIRHPENLGAIANFKFVLDNASSPYFMWAAADDVWDRQWIETLLPIAEAKRCMAFGTVLIIDSDNDAVSHLANYRDFNFVGPKIFRRLQYYLRPGLEGKPNPIYGVYPRDTLTQGCFSALEEYSNGSDMMFLYRYLACNEIRSTKYVTLKKRVHSGCAGGSPQEMQRSLKEKALAYVRSGLIDMLISNYLRESNLFERIIIVLSSPILLSKIYLLHIRSAFK